jgi:hypothetical protein
MRSTQLWKLVAKTISGQKCLNIFGTGLAQVDITTPKSVWNPFNAEKGITEMGLFDKMFGRGASEAEKQPDAQKRFDELKQKYQTVLNIADQERIQFQNLHVQDNKLFIRATAPSEDAKNKFWDQIKLVNASADDITAEISVSEQQAQAATVGGGSGNAQTYTVKGGDTLSKISKQFYGDANEYMRIFYANRDHLKDPDKIQVGQELKIPADNG